MTTRISSPHNINVTQYPDSKVYSAKQSTRGKRKISQSNSTLRTKKLEIKREDSFSDVKLSLRDECLRLASFLKQETHRPGYVR